MPCIPIVLVLCWWLSESLHHLLLHRPVCESTGHPCNNIITLCDDRNLLSRCRRVILLACALLCNTRRDFPVVMSVRFMVIDYFCVIFISKWLKSWWPINDVTSYNIYSLLKFSSMHNDLKWSKGTCTALLVVPVRNSCTNYLVRTWTQHGSVITIYWYFRN